MNAMMAMTSLPHIARSALREIVERDSISLLGLGTPPDSIDRNAMHELASPQPLRISGESQ